MPFTNGWIRIDARFMAGMYCMTDLLDLLVKESADELRLNTDTAPQIMVRGEVRRLDLPVKLLVVESGVQARSEKNPQPCPRTHARFQAFQDGIR